MAMSKYDVGVGDLWKQLPVEIIENIFKYCDTVTLFQMSVAYPHLKQISTSPRLNKIISINLSECKDIFDLKKLRAFLKLLIGNCTIFRAHHLTHRFYSQMLVPLLKKKRRSLHCLDLTGTEINGISLKNVFKEFSCVCLHVNLVYGPGYDDTVWLYTLLSNELHLHVYDIRGFQYFIDYVPYYVYGHEGEDLELHIILYLEEDLELPDISDLFHVGTLSITAGFFLNRFTTFNMRINRDGIELRSFYIFIETYDTIYISQFLYETLLMLKNWSINDVQKNGLNLIPIQKIDEILFVKRAIALFIWSKYYCEPTDFDYTESVLKYVNERIRLRFNTIYYFPTNICVLKKDTLECLCNRKSLITSTCLLATEKKSTVSETPIKKRRISRIGESSEDTGLLTSIINKNPDLETITINNMDVNHSCLSNKNVIYNYKSLWSIGLLKNLKLLFLTIVPLESQKEFFVNIFKNCPKLTTLNVETKLLNSQGTEGLALNLHLCKNLKVFMIKHCFTSNLSKLLVDLSTCPTLEYIRIGEMSYLVNCSIAISENSVLNILRKCPNLLYLTVEQKQLSQRMTTKMNAIISKAKLIKPNIYIDLKKNSNYGRLNPYLNPFYQNNPFHYVRLEDIKAVGAQQYPGESPECP